MRYCDICGTKQLAKGLCYEHYHAARRKTDIRQGLTAQERILRRIEIDTETGCWNWPGAKRGLYGYGNIYEDGKVMATHRVMYRDMVGPLLDGHEIDHLCNNTGCCNPDHLEQVTREENMKRKHQPSA